MSASLFALQTPAQVVKGLGGRVRAHRLAQGLRQEDLSRQSGVALATLKKLEQTGRGSIVHYVLLLRALGLADGLVTLLPEPGPSPMALLEEARRARAPQRQRARRRAAGEA